MGDTCGSLLRSPAGHRLPPVEGCAYTTVLAASWSHSDATLPGGFAQGQCGGSSACSLSLLLLLPYVDTDRRVAVIRFMVILIALSIAQFLTLAATVSPSDTHI